MMSTKISIAIMVFIYWSVSHFESYYVDANFLGIGSNKSVLTQVVDETSADSSMYISGKKPPSMDSLKSDFPTKNEIKPEEFPEHDSKILENSSPVHEGSHPLTVALRVPKNSILSIKEDLKSEEKSLNALMTSLIIQNLEGCHLIILTDGSFKDSSLLETLLLLPNIKQLMFMEDSENLLPTMEWLTTLCQGIILLLSNPDPLILFGTQHLFSWDYKARLIIYGMERQAMLRFIDTKKGKKSENIIAILKGETTGQFFIYMNELYWGERRIRLITKWDGVSFTKRVAFYPDKISDLQHAVLNVAGFQWKPAVFYKRDKDNNILRRYGRDMYVIYALAEAFNFTLGYKETHPDELFGQRLANDSFNGQVGQMFTGEGDLGVANLWLSSLAGRNKFMDFSAPFEVDNSCCMARVEPPLPLWQSPALPFQPQAWLAIFIAMIVSGPLLYALSRLGSVNELEEENLRSLPKSILYSVGVHISHPMAVMPRNPTTQVYIVFFLLYGLILNTGYTSNLISFLTLPKQPYRFETFRELYDNGITLIGIPYLKDVLKFSINPYLNDLAKTYNVKMTFEEITEDILAGRSVSMNSKLYLEFMGRIVATAKKKSKYRMMRECFAFYSVGMVYQKHSPLKDKFDLMIVRLFESGMVRKWFVDSVELYYQYEREDEIDNQSADDRGETTQTTSESGVLRVDHVQGVFILMVCGLSLSTIVFAAEVLI